MGLKILGWHFVAQPVHHIFVLGSNLCLILNKFHKFNNNNKNLNNKILKNLKITYFFAKVLQKFCY